MVIKMNLLNEIFYSHANSYLLLLIFPLGVLILSYLNIIFISDKNKKRMMIMALLIYLLFLSVHFRFISPYGE